jgi:hypothetical protein
LGPGNKLRLREGKYEYRATAPDFKEFKGEFTITGTDNRPVYFEMVPDGPPKFQPPPNPMTGWLNPTEWTAKDGSFVKENDKASFYRTAAGTFSLTTPCNPKKWGLIGKGCRTTLLLRGGPSGELSFEINERSVKVRKAGKTSSDIPLDAKLEEEMRLELSVSSTATKLQVNGVPVAAVDGDYTKGNFGVSSVKAMKDFRHSPK